MITFSSLPSSESVQSRLDSEKAAQLHYIVVCCVIHYTRVVVKGGTKGNGPRVF